jgi:hypothetical protein
LIHHVITRRHALLGGLAIPLGGISFRIPALAKDFWNDKKPGDWTPAEIKELFAKSPWAKDAVIADNGQVGGMNSPRAAAPTRRGGTNQNSRTDSSPAPKITWKAVVRWDSALPLREILGIEAPKEFKDYYVLNVIGNLPGAISATDDREDKASTSYLREVTKLEHKGDDMHLHHVDLSPANDFSPAGTRFYFSRLLDLAPKDKEAQFSTKIGPLDVKCKFSLGEMMYRGALEL